MSEGQGAPERPDEAGEPEPEAAPGAGRPDPAGATPLRRSTVDPAAVLLAVERVGADVSALSRAIAAQPEEVAARVDVDAATAAISVRVGALGSALDQFRLSLLAALDRTADRLDEPAWWPRLQAALAEGATVDEARWVPELRSAVTDLGRRVEAPEWVPLLRAALDDLAEHVRTPGWLPGHQQALVELATTAVPAWLPQVQAALADLAPEPGEPQLRDVMTQLAEVERSLAAALPGSGSNLDGLSNPADDPRLDGLTAAVTRIADHHRLDQMAVEVAGAGPAERLARLEAAIAELADGVRAGGAIADSLDLGQRLVGIEDAAVRMADDARALVEQVGPVPDRLSAIAAQVDRITPLARAGDQAGSLFDNLDRVGTDLQEVVSLLRGRTGSAEQDARNDDERFEGIIEVLAGVTRRQDQLTAAITTVLAQAHGPTGIDAVFERMEQRERSMAARLDRIDAELRRYGGPGSSAEAAPRADAETAQAVQALTVMFEQQDRVLGFRLDYIGAEIEQLREAAPPSAEAPDRLELVLERLQEQETSLASHLTWVGERLAEVAAHLVPDESRAVEDRAALLEALASVAQGQDELAATISARQDELAASLSARPAESAAGLSPGQDDQALPATSDQLADLARRQEELLAAMEVSVDELHGPMAAAAVFDRMEQRERSLAARLDRIDVQLRQRGGAGDSRPSAGLSPVAADSVATSIDAIAAVTEELQELVKATAVRLERRLADVEAALDQATARPGPPPPPTPARPKPSAEVAALRLAELRAERALVQARLQEERLLAAQEWEDE